MPESRARRSQLARATGTGARSYQVAALAGVILLGAGCAYLQRAHGDKAVASAPQAPPTVITPQRDVPIPARPRRPVREARENKEPERVASLDPKSLIGLQPAGVERLLGSPSNVSKSDPSLVWTYAGQGCSFQVFFYPDIKTATFHALKYSSSTGEQIDNACIRSILTVRSNGPS